MEAAVAGLSALLGMIIGSTGATVAVGTWAVSQQRALRERIASASETTESALRRCDDLVARISTREADLAEVHGRAARLDRDLSGKTARNAELEAEVADVRSAAERLDERHRALDKRFGAVEQARDVAKRELAAIQGHAARIGFALASLGIVIPDTPWSPTEPDRRRASRDSLRGLMVDTSASAAALVDREGLITYATGIEEIIERVAVAGALFGIIEPALGALLCAPVCELSLVTRRGSTHLFTVPGTPWLIALENQGDAPRHAATRARLDLFGRPNPWSPIVEISPYVPETSRRPDPDVERMLRSWAERWGVEHVGLLDAAGQVIGSTSAELSGPMLGLRRALGPIFARLDRDGWALDAIEILALASDVGCAVRPIDGDLESPVLVAFGPRLPEAWALDELAGTVRWHLSPMSASPRASGRVE